MNLVRVLFLSILFFGDFALSAQVIQSSGSGRWNQTGTWVGGVVPTAGDSVLIIDGHDITLRSVEACEVIIIEGTSKIRINAGNSLTCDSIIFKPTAINKTFSADVRGNALWRANYFQADINSDNSTISMLGMGRLYIDNDVNIISNAVGATVNAGVPLICQDLTLRTLTGGNGLSFTADDSLYVRDIIIDVQGTSLSSSTTMTTNSQASVIAMSGGFSFPQNSGQVISSASKGILLLDGNSSLSNYTDLQYPTIEIRSGTCSLSEDILNTQFLGNITVDLGATLLTGGYNLLIPQGDLIVNGTLSMDDGDSLIFSGSNAHSISGTGSMIIPNLIVNLVASSLTVNDSVIIREELSVLNGGLVTNDLIRLDSYLVGSAVFGPFGAGATITGNLIIEKIVDNVDNQADWRYIHVPLQNIAISEVNEGVAPNGFYTYGYTGSNQLSAGSYVSTYTYTEGNNNASGGGFADGWTAETDAANLFSSSQGRIFYIGGTSGSGAKSTYSLKATGAVLTGPQSITGLGVSINGGGLNDQGWHLIANPYACPVNLSLANFVGIQGLAAYVYSSTSGSFQTLSTGDVIPAWQSFFVQSTGTGSVTFNESDKNTSHTLDVYKSKAKLDRLVLSLNSDSLGTSTSIRMEEMSGAQSGFDSYDAFGLSNGGHSPNMYFRIDSHDIAINRVAQYEGQSIPLSLYIQAAGYYEIELENSPFGDLCINLEDSETGNIHDLSSEKIVGFNVQNIGVVNRFTLHLNTHPILAQRTENLSCYKSSDGQLELELSPNFDFSLQNNLGDILDQKSNVNGPIVYTDLEAGIYELKFESNSNLCVLNQSIELFQPEEVIPEFEWIGNQMPGVELSFTNKSKGASSFVWDFGDGSTTSAETNPKHTYTDLGVYKVKLLASNGNLDCDQSTESTIELVPTNASDEISEGSQIEIKGGQQIQVTLSSPETSAEIDIYNSIGQLVHSIEGSSDFVFQPTNSGVYIVQVKLRGSSKSSKVLVNLMD